MNLLHPYFSDEIVKALGWTFLHSLWIGALLCIIYLCTQWLLRHQSAGKRYLSGLAFQVLMLLLVAFAFAHSYNEAVSSSATRSAASGTEHIYVAEPAANAGNAVSFKTSGLLTELKSSYFEKYHSAMVGLWMMGIILYALHYIGGYFYTGRLKKQGLVEPGEEIRMLFNSLVKRAEVTKQVRLMESLLVKSPLVVGFFKPVILLPIGLATGLSVPEIEAILSHEIAHIRRHDFLVNILQSCVEIIFFFHPGVWIIGAGIRKERENCCDDVAVSLSGDRISLAKALARTEEWRLQAHVHETFALGFSGNKNSILNRIKRIINNTHMKTQNNDGMLRGNLLAVTLIAGLCFTTLSALKGIDYQAFHGPSKNGNNVSDTSEVNTDKPVSSKNQVKYTSEEAGNPAKPAAEPVGRPLPVTDVAPATVATRAVSSLPAEAATTVGVAPVLAAMASTSTNLAGALAGMPPLPPAGVPPYAVAVLPPFPPDTSERDSIIRLSQEQFARQMEEFAREMAAVQSEIGREMAARAAEMSRMAREMAQQNFADGHEMGLHHSELAEHQREMARAQEEMARHHAEMAREMEGHHREEMTRHEAEMRMHREEMEKMEERLREHERKAKAFEKELKSELIKDGIITPGEARISLKINSEGLVVNGKKQSDEMYKKYRKFINKAWDSGFAAEPSEDDEFSLSFTY